MVGKNLNDNSKIKELNDIENDDLILDIGPKTIQKIKDIIICTTTKREDNQIYKFAKKNNLK